MSSSESSFPAMPDRVLVVGPTAAGKSVAASEIALMTGKPLIHIDQIMLNPETELPIPKDDFLDKAEEVFGRDEYSDGWVADGTYRSIIHLTWEPADVIGLLRPSFGLNVFLAAKRGYTRDTSGGNSPEGTFRLVKRVLETRRYDLSKLDATTQKFQDKVVRAKDSGELVDKIRGLIRTSEE